MAEKPEVSSNSTALSFTPSNSRSFAFSAFAVGIALSNEWLAGRPLSRT
jgi:hypothetical protein